MNILKKMIVLAIAVCGITACANDDMPYYKPGSGAGNSDEGPNSGKADYSKMTAENHPRIIMTDTDLAAIKAKLSTGTDANLTKLHQQMMAFADAILSMADLTYTIKSGRLLETSQAAENYIIASAYAYRMTGEAKYLQKAERTMQTICAFPDWHAMAHFLDGAEMACAVGFGYDWLYNSLSDATKRKAEETIQTFAFYPAFNEQWNLDFYNSASNWNQVCNGGLVIAAMAIYETCPTDAQTIIDKAVESNSRIMPDLYNPDGNYPEGYGYWSYGTGYECLMQAAMESCTGSDNELSNVDGFKKTGKWIMFMEGMNWRPFNYSDCAGNCIAFPQLWYLAHKFNDSSLLYGELRKLDNGHYYDSYDVLRYIPMAMVAGSKFDLNAIPTPSENVWSGKGINPVILVHGDWTFSDTDKFLGIKAGRCNYSHGHMDVGSFVYDAWGTHWSIDLGLQGYGSVENINLPGYTGDFGSYDQGAFRWAVFRYNNRNHSTLTINDALHRVGGRATITSVVNTPQSRGGTIDMSTNLSTQCATALRTVTIDNDQDLVVKDLIKARSDMAANVRWTMVTMAEPTLESGYISLRGEGGKVLYLKVSSSANAKITLKTWSTVGEYYDESNAGTYEVGFEATVPINQTDTFTTTLSPEK